MNGGILPFVLGAIAIGLMFGLCERRLAARGIFASIAAALIGWILPITASETAFFAPLFIGVITLGIAVYIPALRHSLFTLLLGINCGLWLGACAAATRAPTGLAMIALTPIVAAGARWIARRNAIIVVKVVASWMIAIASLALFVSLLPTPGYQPDHME